MRILEHAQLLRGVASADRQLDGVSARRLQDCQPASAAAEAAFAFTQAVRPDADLGCVERARAECDTLRWDVPEIPVHAVQARRARTVERPDRLPLRVLNR